MENGSAAVNISRWVVDKSQTYLEDKSRRIKNLSQLGVSGVARVGLLGLVNSLLHVTGVSGIKEGLDESKGETTPVRLMTVGMRAGADILFPSASSYREDRFRTGESKRDEEAGLMILRGDLEHMVPLLTYLFVALATKNQDLGFQALLMAELGERLTIPVYRSMKAQARLIKDTK